MDEITIAGSNEAVGLPTVQPAWIGFWCFGVINDKLELDDGAAGGRETNKNGDENEEDEFELESGDFSRKCETPVSLLYLVEEEDLARQKFNVLRAFTLLFLVRCSHFSTSNNIIFDESVFFNL